LVSPVGRFELRSFGDDDLQGASRLLAERHERHRACEARGFRPTFLRMSRVLEIG
jgi:hypothetical protein